MRRNRIRIGIASCLLGNPARYDGGHKRDLFMTETLGEFFDWVPVCPEVGCGLPVPRESMELIGDPEHPRLIAKNSHADHTEKMLAWMKKKLPELEKKRLSGFVFKSKSPSCALRGTPIRKTGERGVRKAAGIFAAEVARCFPFLPVVDEIELHDPKRREVFLDKVFVYRRWQDYEEKDGSLSGLIDFHAKHKLILMAHSPRHLRILGNLVAKGKGIPRNKLRRDYSSNLMQALSLPTTTSKNVNVLVHAMGYFKKRLTQEERGEVLSAIERYRQGAVPLLVPLAFLGNYARRHGSAYLLSQYYLFPGELELAAKYHV